MINTHSYHQNGKSTQSDGKHRYHCPPDLPQVNEDTDSKGDGETSLPPHGKSPIY